MRSIVKNYDFRNFRSRLIEKIRKTSREVRKNIFTVIRQSMNEIILLSVRRCSSHSSIYLRCCVENDSLYSRRRWTDSPNKTKETQLTISGASVNQAKRTKRKNRRGQMRYSSSRCWKLDFVFFKQLLKNLVFVSISEWFDEKYKKYIIKYPTLYQRL